MKRILITGGTGFIGSNLVRRFVRDGHEVHLIVRSQSNSWRLIDLMPHIRVHECSDIACYDHIVSVCATIKPEWVFHCAVHGAYSYQTDERLIWHTNFEGTKALVDAMMSVGCDAFVNFGTSSEYGFKDHAPSEDEVLEPTTMYALTKAYATHYCCFSARKNNAPIVTLRPYSVYGPYEEPTRLIPQLILYALKGTYPPLVSPDVARDFLYVDELFFGFFAIAYRCHIRNTAFLTLLLTFLLNWLN